MPCMCTPGAASWASQSRPQACHSPLCLFYSKERWAQWSCCRTLTPQCCCLPVSSQVGCPMRCSFCATGKGGQATFPSPCCKALHKEHSPTLQYVSHHLLHVICAGGFARNLTPHEIVDQVLTVQEQFGRRVSNVVLMGMVRVCGRTGRELCSVLGWQRCTARPTHPAGSLIYTSTLHPYA
jgi:hypothetical protein